MKRVIALLLSLSLLLGCGCSQRSDHPVPTEAPTPEAATPPTPEPTQCPHKSWLHGVCTACGEECPHPEWENGLCMNCGTACAHESYCDGFCAVCGAPCPHTEHDPETGECLLCGATLRHNFVNGVCKCGAKPQFELYDLPTELNEPCEHAGTVDYCYYTIRDGEGTPYTKKMAVYLPYGYDENAQYDVLVLLHGLGGSADYWLTYSQPYQEAGSTLISTKNVLDNLIDRGYCRALIVAAPSFYRDAANMETYNPMWDGRYFYGELRSCILPKLANNYATYAASGSEADLIAARDHIGYAGLSMGSIIAFQSVMPLCLDMVSWYGCFSGFGYDAEYLNGQMKKEPFNQYGINYFYNCVGSMDAAYEEHMEGYRGMLQYCSRLHEGENAHMDTIIYARHEFKTWILGLYNSLQVFFNLPEYDDEPAVIHAPGEAEESAGAELSAEAEPLAETEPPMEAAAPTEPSPTAEPLK